MGHSSAVPLHLWLCYWLQDFQVLVEIIIECRIIGGCGDDGCCNCRLRSFDVIVFLAPPLGYLRGFVDREVSDQSFGSLTEDDAFAGGNAKQFPDTNSGSAESFRGFQPCQAI